jgi:hypothetical protein
MPSKIEEYKFRFILKLEPYKDELGNILEYEPLGRYSNRGNLKKHSCGSFKYCKFKIHANFKYSGVYYIKINNCIKYIGSCKKLNSRFNNGWQYFSTELLSKRSRNKL